VEGPDNNQQPSFRIPHWSRHQVHAAAANRFLRSTGGHPARQIGHGFGGISVLKFLTVHIEDEDF
jgi:hypothetical protein